MQIKPFALERYFARYEFEIEYILCASDCQSMTIGELLTLEPDARDRFQNLGLGYTESLGSPILRREICALYETIAPEHVLVHSGAEEAIFLFMHALLEPGDEVIVHWPCYQSLFEIAHSIGCEVVLWAARLESGWALDLDELECLITPKTRLIVLNTPHNPTGYLMSAEDQARLVRIVQAREITLFSDEVYRESEYNPADRLPAVCDLDERAVSLGVMSKTYGLPGLRIGWVATRNSKLYARLASLKDYTTICNSAPSEFLAELALGHRHILARRSVDLIVSNLRLLDAFFVRHPDRFHWQRPKAGSIAFPRLIGEPVDEFCHRLAHQANVLLLPGTMYQDEGNHFRIGFGRANFPQGLAALEAFIQDT